MFRGALAMGALVIVGVVFAAPASAASAGGCQLQGSANFSPGLGSTSQNFTYNFGGSLSGCQSSDAGAPTSGSVEAGKILTDPATEPDVGDRKSTRLNSSHANISYAVFCLKKKNSSIR